MGVTPAAGRSRHEVHSWSKKERTAAGQNLLKTTRPTELGIAGYPQRLMSVALTEDAVRARAKTVTRRLGWLFLRPYDRLTLCRKVMGRKRRDGTIEPLVRIGILRNTVA